MTALFADTFYPPAQALELGMKLADGGTAWLALFSRFYS
jgi:hypothetical protein